MNDADGKHKHVRCCGVGLCPLVLISCVAAHENATARRRSGNYFVEGRRN